MGTLVGWLGKMKHRNPAAFEAARGTLGTAARWMVQVEPTLRALGLETTWDTLVELVDIELVGIVQTTPEQFTVAPTDLGTAVTMRNLGPPAVLPRLIVWWAQRPEDWKAGFRVGIGQ